MELTKMFTDTNMDKENVVYTNNELFNHKKDILPFQTKETNLEGMILSEVCQTSGCKKKTVL